MIPENTLVEKVRVLLNEADGDSGVSLISDDTLLLDKHIKALLPEAVLFVQMNKNSGTVNVKSTNSADLSKNLMEGAEVQLPSDYIRLVSLKLTSWLVPCRFAYASGSRMESLQKNKYMRAGASSPVCFEACNDYMENVLIAYPAPKSGSDVYVEHLVYEARYNPAEGITGGDESLVTAVTYQCAALLCNVFGKFDAANVFMGIAATLCSNGK